MTTAAKNSFGNSLWIAAHGITPLVKVAELLSFDPPQPQRAMQDATTLDSAAGAEEVIPEGTYNPGGIKGQVHYLAGSAGDTAMLAAFGGATLMDYKIVVKSAAATYDLTGTAYLTTYGPDGQTVRGKQTAAFEFKVSGAQTQALSA